MQLASDLLLAHSQAAVAQLIERHDWRLLTEDEFVHRLVVRTQASGALEREPLVRVAVNLYCEILYEACRNGGERQKRAYLELARYLYDRALNKYRDPELAQEITHDAIVLIHEQLDQCRHPGGFLAFAQYELWHAATAYFRQRKRWVTRVESLSNAPQEEAAPERLDPQALSPETATLNGILTDTLLGRIDELIQSAPRSRNQLAAVLLKFIGGYSDEEIARELDTEVANIHVLRSRGLSRLRNDPVLSQLAADYLSTNDRYTE